VNHRAAEYVIRAAGTADAGQIMGLLDEAVEWLAGLGLDQWQDNRDRQRTHVETDLAEGTVFVVEHLDRVIATITVDQFADADFWRENDDIRDALYVHRMAVARDEAGIGLGSAMLDWAGGRAERFRRSWLRLDAWSTNDKLHFYYEQLGFTMVRNTPVEGRGSGALFARPAGYRHGGGLRLTNLVHNTADGAGGSSPTAVV
jgi:GNAT superfamily N-acetyltransferase